LRQFNWFVRVSFGRWFLKHDAEHFRYCRSSSSTGQLELLPE
jgi:hypothetical protein